MKKSQGVYVQIFKKLLEAHFEVCVCHNFFKVFPIPSVTFSLKKTDHHIAWLRFSRKWANSTLARHWKWRLDCNSQKKQLKGSYRFHSSPMNSRLNFILRCLRSVLLLFRNRFEEIMRQGTLSFCTIVLYSKTK